MRSLPNGEAAATQLTSKCAAYTAFKEDSSQGHLAAICSERTAGTFFPGPLPLAPSALRRGREPRAAASKYPREAWSCAPSQDFIEHLG